MRRRRLKLARVRAGKPGDIAGVLDDHHLQTEAQPEAGKVVFAGVGGSGDLSFDPPFAEAARNDDAVKEGEVSLGRLGGNMLGLHPFDLDLRLVEESAVAQGFCHREVGVGQIDVLADDADPHRVDGVLAAFDDRLPLVEVDRLLGVIEAERATDDLVESLVVQ